MRVLHFYKTYKPDTIGGIEQVIGEICSGSARRGVASDVLTVSRNTSTVDLGDHMHYRARLDLNIASSAFSLSSLSRLKELSQHADVIHYHFPWPFMDMAHFLTRLNKPTVVTYHSDIVRQKTLPHFYRPLMMRFLGSATLGQIFQVVLQAVNGSAVAPLVGTSPGDETWEEGSL